MSKNRLSIPSQRTKVNIKKNFRYFATNKLVPRLLNPHGENVRTSKFCQESKEKIKFLRISTKVLIKAKKSNLSHACVPLTICSTAVETVALVSFGKQYKKHLHLLEFLAIAVREKNEKLIYSRSFVDLKT
jgi:hypothetical protein